MFAVQPPTKRLGNQNKFLMNAMLTATLASVLYGVNTPRAKINNWSEAATNVLSFCFTQKITWAWIAMNHDLPNFANLRKIKNETF